MVDKSEATYIVGDTTNKESHYQGPSFLYSDPSWFP